LIKGSMIDLFSVQSTANKHLIMNSVSIGS
jgi:hypothetical protein